MNDRRAWALLLGSVLTRCGGGTIQSEDVPFGTAVVIGVGVVIALLFIAAAGRRK
ncbi:MAG: hypothetical protein M3345_02515 [Actinomycetota bacterium]|nr:hypothetical protein [Actinomycetota bacterium]